MRLYAYWRSSASWRVRIGLHHKGLPFDITSIHLRDGVQRSEAHRARNAMAQVPVLELQAGATLTQSIAILEWLDERYPDPPLLPEDPLPRARVRQAAEIINSGIQPLQNLVVLKAIADLGGDRMAWGRTVIADGLAAVEALAQIRGGTFTVGDQPTIADCCLVPQLYNARRFSVDMSAFPKLLEIEAACASLPAFQAAHPDQQPDANT